MRVLYLTDSLSDLDGVGRYGLRLIGALEREDAEFSAEILLARKHRPTSPSVPERWKCKVALPPDYFFYMSSSRFWASFFLALPTVVRAARRADVVHAIKDFPHNWLALWAARLAGKPCVATAHGTYTIQPLLDERHRERALKTYAGLSRMIAVSGYTRRRLLELLEGRPPLPERVAVIPNAVDAEHYVEKRAVGERPWHGKRFTLGIGEVKERKGHHLSIGAWCEVAPQIEDLHHFVVGKITPDAYHESLLDQARAAGLGDRLHFLGNVDEDEKVDLLQRADVFLHTPVTSADGGFEGFGIVYLEAAACGTPTIGTVDCGAEDAIVDGTTGFLARQEVASIAAPLLDLLADDAQRERLGRAGQLHASGNSWASNAQQVHRLYTEAIEERR